VSFGREAEASLEAEFREIVKLKAELYARPDEDNNRRAAIEATKFERTHGSDMKETEEQGTRAARRLRR
jgi:hypothetical protein